MTDRQHAYVRETCRMCNGTGRSNIRAPGGQCGTRRGTTFKPCSWCLGDGYTEIRQPIDRPEERGK